MLKKKLLSNLINRHLSRLEIDSNDGIDLFYYLALAFLSLQSNGIIVGSFINIHYCLLNISLINH